MLSKHTEHGITITFKLHGHVFFVIAKFIAQRLKIYEIRPLYAMTKIDLRRHVLYIFTSIQKNIVSKIFNIIRTRLIYFHLKYT